MAMPPRILPQGTTRKGQRAAPERGLLGPGPGAGSGEQLRLRNIATRLWESSAFGVPDDLRVGWGVWKGLAAVAGRGCSGCGHHDIWLKGAVVLSLPSSMPSQVLGVHYAKTEYSMKLDPGVVRRYITKRQQTRNSALHKGTLGAKERDAVSVRCRALTTWLVACGECKHSEH